MSLLTWWHLILNRLFRRFEVAKCVISALQQPSPSGCSALHPPSSPSTAPGCHLPTSALARGPRLTLCTCMPLGCACWLHSPLQAKALALTQLILTWDLLPVNEKRRIWKGPAPGHHCPAICRGFLNVITQCCDRTEDVETAYKKAKSWRNFMSDACTEPFPLGRTTGRADPRTGAVGSEGLTWEAGLEVTALPLPTRLPPRLPQLSPAPYAVVGFHPCQTGESKPYSGNVSFLH